MKLIAIIFATLLLPLVSTAQDPNIKALKKDALKSITKDPKDTVISRWKNGGSFAVNLNQGSLSNWSAGGEQFSLSINNYVNLYSFFKDGKHSWDNSLDLNYGFVNTTSLGMRKASDRINFLSKYGREIKKELSVAALVDFRSQFANGFAYSTTSAGVDTQSLTSKTLQPAYTLGSLGLDYKPNTDISLFVSPITARWIIVGNDNLKPIYNVPLNKSARQEIGAFASVNYLKAISKTITYKSKLDLFSNYKSNPENVDIFFTNVITAKLLKYINFSLNVDLIYDDDVANTKAGRGPAPQILQLMGIGFAYTINKKNQ
jgi:hypothetical protein